LGILNFDPPNYIHFTIEKDTIKENQSNSIAPNIGDTEMKNLKKNKHWKINTTRR